MKPNIPIATYAKSCELTEGITISPFNVDDELSLLLSPDNHRLTTDNGLSNKSIERYAGKISGIEARI
jgi:hypothetical protein